VDLEFSLGAGVGESQVGVLVARMRGEMGGRRKGKMAGGNANEDGEMVRG
jgi:hypothetical protein